MIGTSYKVFDNGDSAITIIFEHPICEELSRMIITIAEQINTQLANQFEDIIPGYQSLTLCYNILNSLDSNSDPLQDITPIIDYHLSSGRVDKNTTDENQYNHTQGPDKTIKRQAKLIEIPVCYEDEYALDQSRILQHTGLTSEQLITIHSKGKYLVHMLGFMPGFLYLGGLDKRLHCPRKEVPATRIPAGSVGIGGQHTGIYPGSGPGGWNIIGQTPLKLFNPEHSKPFIASPLDSIRFVPITKNQFATMLNAEEYQGE